MASNKKWEGDRDPAPTFDEWFVTKYGASFETLHMKGNDRIHDSMRRLSELMREYVSDMVAALTT